MTWEEVIDALRVYMNETEIEDEKDEIDEQIEKDYNHLLLCSLFCKSRSEFTYTGISSTTAYYLSLCEDYSSKHIFPTTNRSLYQYLKKKLKKEVMK